ncbi:CapA family protein [candidate division WOR-3 bacterium]|nr:CapA family protein [candidate division WOR-3 bacterium]
MIYWMLFLTKVYQVFFDPVLITQSFIFDNFQLREYLEEPRKENTSIIITLSGDVNMSVSKTWVDSSGAVSNRGVLPFSIFTDSIKEYIEGDINFCNLETTVLNDNSLANADKSYCFRMHTNALKHLAQTGFNLFALANNHMEDYGTRGVLQTLENIKILSSECTLFFAGAGADYDEAVMPFIFEIKGHRFAFSSLGISGLPATSSSPGVALTSFSEKVLGDLSSVEADYRILALHAGNERNEYVTYLQNSIIKKALEEYEIDLVVGTHPHIVQGAEYYEGRMAFYSLGNFLMLGARNMSTVENSLYKKDFGLFVKIFLSDSLEIDSVTVHPVFNMHFQPYFLSDSVDVAMRVEWLNKISNRPYMTPIEENIIFQCDGVRGIFVP